MGSHRQHLDAAVEFAIDQIEAENPEADSVDRRREHDRMAPRRFASQCERPPKFRVVALTQSLLTLLVVGNLPAMLRGRLRMQRILHRSSACTCSSSSCPSTNVTRLWSISSALRWASCNQR